MSVNHVIPLSVPIHIVTAFTVGCGAALGCGAVLASLMVSRGLGLSAVGPFVTIAACAGSFVGSWLLAMFQKSRGLLWGGMLGIFYALTLAGIQLANESIPDPAQAIRLGLMILAGAVGGYTGTIFVGKKRRH